MKEKYIAAERPRRKFAIPEAPFAPKPRAKLPAAFFAVLAAVFAIRTVIFLGWPVFSLDGRFFSFPRRLSAKKTGIFASRAAGILPAASSCKKYRHLRKRTGRLSS